MTALTIGMATYDDFDGVYFTIEAIRLYQDVSDTEFLVIDNYGCDTTKSFVEATALARYVRATDVVGTAAAKDLVFKRAAGRAVLCIDSHVLLVPDAVARLKRYYEEHPDTNDLLQGPLLYDDLATISTHFRPEWSGQMWGVWDTDQRGLDPDGEPFDIPMQGMGLFSCRRRAWPGFHPLFRGFGGEEGYIHEKVRQRGNRSLCLPWLRWVHRFGRAKGVPYPLSVEDKLRNYVIGFTDLGLDLQPALDHFTEFLPAETIERVREDALREMAAPAASAKVSRAKAKDRKRRAKATAEPEEEPFDADMAGALLDAIPDEVRIAFGFEPLAVEGFPPPGPERQAAHAESRSLLLSQGWLDEVDLETLSIDEAIATARRTVLENLRFSKAIADDGEFARLGITPFGSVSLDEGKLGSADGAHAPPGSPELPLVSCICPTFNRAPDYLHLVEEAVESFLRQTYPNKELIVLNDCPNQKLVCDAPGVRVVNAPRRYPTLGDKYNAAIALARGDLIAPWEDDDISLPWRLSLSVERLGNAGYYNPRRYWFIIDGEVHGDHSMGYGHNLSLYTREAFERVGGYASISGPQDAKMDSALIAQVECRGLPDSGEPELPMQEWYYVYRWGVSPSHLSAFASPEEFYRSGGEQPIQRGRFVLRPHWRQDYVAAINEQLAKPVG